MRILETYFQWEKERYKFLIWCSNWFQLILINSPIWHRTSLKRTFEYFRFFVFGKIFSHLRCWIVSHFSVISRCTMLLVTNSIPLFRVFRHECSMFVLSIYFIVSTTGLNERRRWKKWITRSDACTRCETHATCEPQTLHEWNAEEKHVFHRKWKTRQPTEPTLGI